MSRRQQLWRNPNDEDKRQALLAENIINEVGKESGGRAIQVENAVLSQFLGGSVYYHLSVLLLEETKTAGIR